MVSSAIKIARERGISRHNLKFEIDVVVSLTGYLVTNMQADDDDTRVRSSVVSSLSFCSLRPVFRQQSRNAGGHKVADLATSTLFKLILEIYS
jgi:hypothetical protein